MSLEQAIADLTTAVRENTAALTRSAVVLTDADAAADAAGTPRPDNPTAQATAAQAAEKPKRGRPPAVKPAANFGPVNSGDPEGTTYWFNAKHDSAYRITPTDPQTDMMGSEQITAAAFNEHQTRLAAKYASAATAQAAQSAAKAPTTVAPTTTAAGASDYNAVRAALLQLAKDDPVKGRERVLAILAQFKVNAVPDLASATADVLAQVMAAAKAPAAAESDALFG
jgi:hypothetical protein